MQKEAKKYKNICKKNNIHLIIDEIYTGTGICGSYNCFQWDNFEPDFLLICPQIIID
mgnify:CR=1 FL=1